jgi:hypothetical protein
VRILVTGSTSQQSNPDAHKRAANFTGLLFETLRSDERSEVFWKEPSVTWTEADLDEYDHVFVGLAPLMAMGANRVYGALSVVERLWGSRRLTVVLDSPDPDLFTRSLRSTLGNWESFTKAFFSYRKEFDLARGPEVSDRLRSGAERLMASTWPRTVVPGLPWTEAARIAAALPSGASGRVQTVNLDHLLLRRFGKERAEVPRLREWAYEKSGDRRWLPSQNLGLPVRELPSNHRIATDPLAVQQLRESVGLLVGPIRGEVWWTPKVAMSLAVLTPVFTDWHQSRLLGAEWTHLPGPHELARPEEAEELANDQYVSFVNSIPGPSEALRSLYAAANVKNRPRKAAS